MSIRKPFFLSHYLEYAFVRGLFGLLSIFSYTSRIQFIHCILRILSMISSTIPNRIKGGLRQAFPSIQNEELEAIYKENLRITARMAVDFKEGPRMDEYFVNKKFLYEPSKEIFLNICKGGGLLVLGHLGNWETHGVGITHLLTGSGVELYVFSKRQSNLLTNDWVERTRRAQNIKLIYTDESPRVAISLLKKGHLVALIADQDAGMNGLFVPFLGKLASTYIGPAVFARNTKCPIHFMWSRYTPEGQLLLGATPLERPNIDPRNNPDLWEKSFTYRWVKILEKKVLEHPASYFWLHRRWKRQPSNPEAIYKFWKEFAERG